MVSVLFVSVLFVLQGCSQDAVGRKVFVKDTGGKGAGNISNVSDYSVNVRNFKEMKNIYYDSYGERVYRKLDDRSFEVGESYELIKISRSSAVLVPRNPDERVSGVEPLRNPTCGCAIDIFEGHGDVCTASCTLTYDGGVGTCSGSCSGDACVRETCTIGEEGFS